jgi:uncharacterized protein involved in exopolysaccharide biosynthesis
MMKDSKGGGSMQLAGLLGIKSGPSAAGFPNVLASRSVAEAVFDDLDLAHRIPDWDNPAANKSELITLLMSMVEITVGETADIKARADNPVLAADIANEYPLAAEKVWKMMNYTEARKKKEYIESQLPRVTGELKSSEERIKRYGLLSVDPSSLAGVESLRLQREYEIQSKTYLMLRGEYESVKLDESKELAPFSVIDRAEVPIKPASAKAGLRFVVGFIFGALISFFLIIFIEYWNKTARR